MKIELIPNSQGKSSSVRMRLTTALQDCILLKGAVAFVTISPEYITELPDKLSSKESFLCVDMHSPTDINSLAGFVENGANIFLHNYELALNIEKENKINALMHTKILHFEFSNGNTETWIGSHNLTRKALDGMNFEATAVVRTEQKTEEEIIFVKDITEYLNVIKNSCIEFVIEDISFYKLLQGEKDAENEFDVIEIVGRDISKLLQEKTIQIISKDVSDFDKYKLVNKRVFLHCLDIETQIEHVFETIISNAGLITDNEKTHEIVFSQRRYAIREKNMLPYLQFEEVIDTDLLQISKYFINLDLKREWINCGVYEKPTKKQKNWNYFSKSPHSERMDKDDLARLISYKKFSIRKGAKNEIEPKRVALPQIILKADQEYLVDYFENDRYNFKYKLAEDIDNDVSKSIERKQLFVKRIIIKE